MTDDQIMQALGSLPDPELMQESKITDPPGSDVFYSARTVVMLLAKERERCAKYIEDENLWRGGQGQQGLMTPEEMARGIRAMR